MRLLCTLVNAAALAYGGITDYRKREIPNLVPIVLLATGIVSGEAILARLVLMLIVAAALWLSGMITRHRPPGGDVKLICALCFSAGLPMLLITMVLVGGGSVGYGLLKRIPLRRSIPLCTYVAPAYLAAVIVALL